MVVGVAGVDLEYLVVDVADRELRLDAGHAHRLELQVGQGAGGVLGQRLVDSDADLLAGHHLADDEMLGDQLPRQVLFLGHCG